MTKRIRKYLYRASPKFEGRNLNMCIKVGATEEFRFAKFQFEGSKYPRIQERVENH